MQTLFAQSEQYRKTKVCSWRLAFARTALHGCGMQIRLREFRTARKWTLDHLAEVSGLSKSFLSQIETGARQPSMETISTLAQVLGIDDRELLFENPTDTPQIVPLDTPAPNGTTLVPIYNVAASAGPGALVSEHEMVTESLAFPPEYLRTLTGTNPRHLQIIGVVGDSMKPTLKHDDIVMLDRTKTNLAYDGLFVIRYRDILQVKRLAWSERKDFVTVLSDNKEYPPRDYPAGDVEVIGKVIWSGGKV